MISAKIVQPCSYGLPCLSDKTSAPSLPSDSIINLPAIIGGSIGGFLLLLLLAIILGVFIKRKDKCRRNKLYEKPYNKPYYDKNYEIENPKLTEMYSETVIHQTNSNNNKGTELEQSNSYDYLYDKINPEHKLQSKAKSDVQNKINTLEVKNENENVKETKN